MLLASRYGTISSVAGGQVAAVVSSNNGASWTTDGTNWNYVAYSLAENQPTGGFINDDLILFAGNSTDEGRKSVDNGLSYSDINIWAVTIGGGTAQIASDGSGTIAVSGTDSSAGIARWALTFTTNDGVSFTTDYPTSTAGTNVCRVLLYDGTQWITGGSNGAGNRIQTKTTLGTGSWTGRSTIFSDVRGMDYDGTTYIVGVNQSSVYTTTDLTTFTARSVGATVSFIAHGNGVWLAAGNDIYRSTNDGVSWSFAYTPTTVRQMRWSPTLQLFIVTTNSGNVLTSPDGSTWTTTNVGTADTLYGIATR